MGMHACSAGSCPLELKMLVRAEQGSEVLEALVALLKEDIRQAAYDELVATTPHAPEVRPPAPPLPARLPTRPWLTPGKPNHPVRRALDVLLAI
jgi:hypothetical protein